ncbi:tyrosine-type recombinase/integrase [Phototrophicus methaneseepsis]|uniref:Tyrosine-type recombinase/integrase n=1 Tax=Phototrophicus methaneseepsis TaxID=2710758 RepID=A0A7S8E863_9CHLR|nr:tyrosine-type recombinase/integrase [Phototrophicus methaneseepsis]QPC82132.1 tyrosine-type recombinase/integrase [Phototrophicus methaneseepsis]
MSKAISLAEAADLFLMAAPYSQTSKQNYEIFLTKTLASYIAAARPVDEITHGDLIRFVAYCEHDRGVSCRSLKQYTYFLRSFFRWCLRAGYIENDPAAALLTPKCVKDGSRVRGIPPAHLRKMLDYTEQTSKRNYALILFMAVTGCRVRAASELRCSNLDLQLGYARLLEKGRRWVVYEFDQLTAAALSDWLMKRPNVDHDYVWTGRGPHYEPLKHQGIRSMLTYLCQKLELPHYTPHQIRHSAGEILANHDHSELAVASALNHQSLQSARIYMPQRMAETRHLRHDIEATLYPDRVDSQLEKPRAVGRPILKIVK